MKPQVTWHRNSGEQPAEPKGDRAEPEPNRQRSVLLQAATERVEASKRVPEAEESEAGTALQVLHMLADAVQETLDGHEGLVDRRLRTPLARGLLQLIRAEVFHVAEEHHSIESAEVVDTLQAVLEVEQAIDPAWGLQSLAPPFGAEATELVVELAHDLRSPVTSVLFLAETLRSGRSGQVTPLQHRQLGLVYSAALALSTVASDLIELAHGGDRLVDRKPVPFSVRETLESVRDIVQPIAEEKQLAVNLVPSTADYRLGYPMALRRVLLNLTSNALKFTAEGEIEIVARSKDMTKVEFAVRDTGPGVNPEALATLYQPFRRAKDRSGYSFSGTGLGLVICRRLVRAMSSELKVETRPNWGTRFFFEVDLPSAAAV